MLFWEGKWFTFKMSDATTGLVKDLNTRAVPSMGEGYMRLMKLLAF